MCTRLEIGEECAANVLADPRPPALMVQATVKQTRGLRRLERFADRSRRAPSPAPPQAFQHRRSVNVERLNAADCVIAMSQRVAEIYARLGVEDVRTVHLTLAHIAQLTPRARPVRS